LNESAEGKDCAGTKQPLADFQTDWRKPVRGGRMFACRHGSPVLEAFFHLFFSLAGLNSATGRVLLYFNSTDQ
jgi:hypothetical protein